MNFKKYISLIFILSFVTLLFGQEVNKVQEEMMIGNIKVKDFLKEPHKNWYKKEYNAYIIDLKTLKKSGKIDKKIEIMVFFGSWCGDSKREVPRFNKILDYLKVKNKNVKYIGLDRSKRAPVYIENIYNIEYVPSFIFFKNGKEIGRIIESPEESLEIDILKIMSAIRAK